MVRLTSTNTKKWQGRTTIQYHPSQRKQQLALSIVFFLYNCLLKSTAFVIHNQHSRIKRHNSVKMAATTTENLLTCITPEEVVMECKDPVDPTALEQAKAILSELTTSGSGTVDTVKLVEVAQRLGDIPKDQDSFLVTKEACQSAYENLSSTDRAALDNIHARVKAFADAQRRSVTDMEMDIPGGKAGHTVSPCKGASYFKKHK